MFAPALQATGLDSELVKMLYLFGMSETEMLIHWLPELKADIECDGPLESAYMVGLSDTNGS
jgi:hypothetical protein